MENKNIEIYSLEDDEINEYIKKKYIIIILTEKNIGKKLFNYFDKDMNDLTLIALSKQPFTLKEVKEILKKEYEL